MPDQPEPQGPQPAHEAARGAQPPALTRAADLLQAADQPNRWLVDALLPRGALTVLAGPPKVGKSLLALSLAVAVASGQPFLGRAVQPGPVFFWALEDGPDRLRARLRAILGRAGDDPVARAAALPLHLSWAQTSGQPETLRRFFAEVYRHHPVLLVLDPLREFHSRDENNSARMAGLLRPLRSLARSENLAVLLVHHTRKDDHRSFAAIRGSSAIFAAVDGALLLTAPPDRPNALLLQASLRDATPADPLHLALAPDLIFTDRPPDPAAADHRQAARFRHALDLADQPDGLTRADYQAATGVSLATAIRDLQALVALGLLRRVGTGPTARYQRTD